MFTFYFTWMIKHYLYLITVQRLSDVSNFMFSNGYIRTVFKPLSMKHASDFAADERSTFQDGLSL